MIYSHKDKFTATQDQSDAISHPPAPLMILAGAATGKTTTLLHRIIYLIKNLSISPESILAITYTERAAYELKNRLILELGEYVNGITISTFHSFCYHLIQEYDSFNSTLRLIEESESIYLMLSDFDSLRPFHSDEFPLNPQKSVGMALSFINKCRDELLEPKDLNINILKDSLFEIEQISQLKDIRKMYEFYQHIKSDHGFVDYGDMIVRAGLLLKNESEILKNIQSKFQHIIIDEFQDNNYALNKVIGLISQKNQSITVVGDDDQTIYSFRGASKYNLTFFRDMYQAHPNYKEITLKTSFRSHQKVLSVANDIIKENSERIEKKLVSFQNKTGEKPTLIYANVTDHPLIIVDKIKAFIQMGIPLKEIAVLVRSISKAKIMVHHLRRSRIPVTGRFDTFFDLEIIKILNAWCQVIGNGSYQDSSLFYLIKKSIGLTQTNILFKFVNKWSQKSAMDQLLSSKYQLPDLQKLDLFFHRIHTLKSQSKKKTAGELIWDICVKTEILRPLVNRYDYFDQLSLINVGQFIKKAQQFSERDKEIRGIYEFNLYIETLMVTGGIQVQYPDMGHDPEGVTVSTIHGVKGGEFTVVFIPYNRSAIFPLNFKRNPIIEKPPDAWMTYKTHSDLTPKEHHYEEERRLLYVAITRAKNHLYLLAPEKSTSPFIKKLDKSLIIEEVMEPIKSEILSKESKTSLRDIYEQKLQNALAKNNFERAKNMVNSLQVIKNCEQGIRFEPDPNQDWEKKLAHEIEQTDVSINDDELILSSTAIDTYKSCPLKYRLSFQDNVPESASKPQMAFGSIIHKVLQRYHEPEKHLTEERILRLLEEEWKPDEFDYVAREEKFREQGESILCEYSKRYNESPSHIIYREYPFEFSLDDSVRIRGKIDRIDKNKNGYSVIDYKTSKTPIKADKNIQLAVYCLFLLQSTDEHLKGIPNSASLYFLREKDNPLRTHSFSEEELIETKTQILNVAHQIRTHQFEPKKGFHCDWCDYKHLLCPEWETKF